MDSLFVEEIAVDEFECNLQQVMKIMSMYFKS